MRKVLSILLLAFFGVTFAAPLFALSARTEDNLAACCRRNGDHHCMLSMADRQRLNSDDAVKVSAPMGRCPYCPATFSAGSQLFSYLAAASEAELLPPASHPAGIAQSESKLRIAQVRARQKRGPPASSLQLFA